MTFLIIIHAMAAVLGVGPTFFIHALFRKHQNVGQLRHSLGIAAVLNFFPKIGGTIAVVTGLLLVFLSDWTFAHLWISGSLLLYVAIQVVAVGMAPPLIKKLDQWVAETKLDDGKELPAEPSALVAKTNGLYWVTTVMGAVLFLFMFWKPL